MEHAQKKRATHATARMQGGQMFPALHGTVHFRQVRQGVLVTAEIFDLPTEKDGFPAYGIFGFHIHQHGLCADETDFSSAGGHYNPSGTPHPFHAGDLPPLFGNHGYAYMQFLTDRFTLPEVLGRALILHSQPDDFTSQPAGNSGARIACGLIEAR